MRETGNTERKGGLESIAHGESVGGKEKCGREESDSVAGNE